MDYLRKCNLLHQVTSEETLRRVFALPPTRAASISAYLGIDPTAPSLHVGHLLGLHVLRRMPTRKIVLMGGATALIGDPSGRTEERKHLVSEEQVRENASSVARQVERYFEEEGEKVKIVNNIDWTANLSTVTFLRDVGKHFRLLEMLKRDSVMMKRNLETKNPEEGISFTELSYQVLQGYDFLHLYQTESCRIQIGGSDQWGNIVGGVDLIKRRFPTTPPVEEETIPPLGVTFPLVTIGKDKQKLGKSAGNAVWLDRGLTSDFDFYQYFMRLEDEDARRMCTMFGVDENEAEGKNEKLDAGGSASSSSHQQYQIALARAVTRRVRGEDGVTKAETLTHALYGPREALSGPTTMSDPNNVARLREAIVEAGLRVAKIPSASSPSRLLVTELAVMCGLASSNGEARRLQTAGGLYINGRRSNSGESVDPRVDFLGGRLCVMRVGQKKWGILEYEG